MFDVLRPTLTTDVILRSVGPDTHRRGAVYADQGRVSDVSYSQQHATISAGVRGSGGRIYTTVAEFDSSDSR